MSVKTKNQTVKLNKVKFELSPTQKQNLSKVVLQNGKPLIKVEYLDKESPEKRLVEFATQGYINLVVSVFLVFILNLFKRCPIFNFFPYQMRNFFNT